MVLDINHVVVHICYAFLLRMLHKERIKCERSQYDDRPKIIQ